MPPILPSTLKNVTIPVAPAVPIPCDRISLVELIPMLYEPINSDFVVDRPPTFTVTPFWRLIDVDAIPTSVSPETL